MSFLSLVRLFISREMIDTTNNKIILPYVLRTISINGCIYLPSGEYNMCILHPSHPFHPTT